MLYNAIKFVGPTLLLLAPILQAEAQDNDLAGEALASQAAGIEQEAKLDDASQPQDLLASGLDDGAVGRFLIAVSQIPEANGSVDELVEEMLVRGPKVENWESTGIDMHAELTALEGGLEGNLLYDTDAEVPNVIDLSGMSNPGLSDFHRYEIYPEPDGVTERFYFSHQPGFWFEGSSVSYKKGNAKCSGDGPTGLTLHSVKPYADWTQDEMYNTMFMFSLVDRLSTVPMCEVFHRNEDGTYTSILYDRNGATLPVMDEESTPMAILPVEGLSEHLRGF